MTVKTWVTTQKFQFIDDNSRVEDNYCKKTLLDLLPLHAEKSCAKIATSFRRSRVLRALYISLKVAKTKVFAG